MELIIRIFSIIHVSTELGFKFKAALTKKIGSKIDTAELDDEIALIEDKIEAINMRIDNLQKNKISEEAVYQILLQFDKIYSELTDLEKKRFLKSFVKDVFIHEQDLEDGRFLKKIRFRFPIFYNGIETRRKICIIPI